VSYGYDAYAKKLQAFLETRAADLHLDHPHATSAKAKGKRRATGDGTDLETSLIPQEYELPPEFHPAVALAKSVLGHRAVGDDRIVGARRGSTRLDRREMEAEIKQRLPSLEYKVDRIFSMVSAARTATDIAEKALNERFEILTANLTSRIKPFPQTGEVPGSAGSSAQLLSTYVAEPRSRSVGPDPLDLMRALSRVDQERPPTQVGDAARRAAREVQRADERGVVAVGDRRLTEVPATPKKAPATPRRGTTPSRDR
jgi:kinetochore protein Mis13/DSN1